jgi:hypothetical protein
MPQKLFIPYIGSVFVLTEDWAFQLHFEGRNKLLQALCPSPRPDKPVKYGPAADYIERNAYWDAYNNHKNHGMNPRDWEGSNRLRIEKAMTEDELALASRTFRSTRRKDRYYVAATLPAGTPLRVDRVYIRRGIDAYSSLTYGITRECSDKKIRGKKFWASLKDVNTIVCEPI